MRKLVNRVRKVNAQVLGLDIHQDLIAYCLLDRRGNEIESGEVGGQPFELEALLDRCIGRKKTHVAFEASGSSYWVFDLLCSRYGRERVHVGHAGKIRAIANSKEKNNANDAFWVAYLTHEGRLPEAHIPEAAIRELRIATRDRIRAVSRHSDLVRRLRSHVRQLGESFPTRGVDTVGAQEFLGQLLSRIDGSRRMAILHVLEEMTSQRHVIKSWDDRIGEVVQGLPDVHLLERQIPGVGKVLAATIVAESGDIRRFPAAKSYGRYTGLTPSDRSTGTKTTHGKICREGSPYLRWALTQATMACTRAKHGAPLVVGDWIRQRYRRYGCKVKVRCAAARKLAETIWRLFHYGECFDAAKPFGGKKDTA